MRFKVTGGKDGLSGIEVKGRRYEPGETVEMTGTEADWLVAQGYLDAGDGKAPKTAPAPAAEPEPAPAPAEPADSPTEANPTDTAEVTE